MARSLKQGSQEKAEYMTATGVSLTNSANRLALGSGPYMSFR
jgi:hypothetical protein